MKNDGLLPNQPQMPQWSRTDADFNRSLTGAVSYFHSSGSQMTFIYELESISNLKDMLSKMKQDKMPKILKTGNRILELGAVRAKASAGVLKGALR